MKMISLINLRSFFLAFVPVLGIYVVLPGLTLDVLILIILLILEIILRRKDVGINLKVVLLFTVLVCCNLLAYLFSSTSVKSIFINNLLQMISFAVLLSYYIQQPINSVFKKTLEYLGVLASVFVFVQFIGYWVLGESITLFLPLNTSVEDLDLLVSIGYGRPNSFFLEPAHFAIFILPIFFYSLVEKKYLLSFIYILGILFSTSTTGFAILILILIYHFVFQRRNFKLLIVIGMLSIPLLFFSEYYDILFESNLDKLGTESLGENDRLLGSIPLVNRMDFLSWIFGLGYNQMADFFKTLGVFVKNYSNSFLMSFFSFGIVGLLSLILYLIGLIKINLNKGYLIIFILILASDQILFNRNFFYLVCCIYFLQSATEDQKSLLT